MFDSVHNNISSDTINQICSIVHSQKKSIKIEIMDVLKQRGSTDCGLFALVFATSLCHEELPSERKYIQGDLRAHLSSIFELNNPSVKPFPSSNRQKEENDYCGILLLPLARRRQLIECCQCSEWYHDECEVIDQAIWENKETDWVCKKCSSQRIKRRK